MRAKRRRSAEEEEACSGGKEKREGEEVQRGNLLPPSIQVLVSSSPGRAGSSHAGGGKAYAGMRSWNTITHRHLQIREIKRRERKRSEAMRREVSLQRPCLIHPEGRHTKQKCLPACLPASAHRSYMHTKNASKKKEKCYYD